MIGTTLQIVGERLCEAVDLRAGERVLDVAAGNGNATLAAARHFAQVTSTDYVGELLERGKERAAAERLTVTFQTADAEALPFPDNSFDVALSTFGVMFTPEPGQGGGGAPAHGPQGRPHRPRQLDARRLHRPALQDARQARAAAGRRALARAVGHRAAPRRAVLRPRRRGDEADLPLPLQVAGPLAGDLPDLLRPDQPRLRGARRRRNRPRWNPTSSSCSS